MGLAMLGIGSGWLVPRPAAAASTTSVTVFLKAPNPAALASLAGRRGLSRAQRIHAVERLLPTAKDRSTAIRVLASESFTVTSQTAWSVTASGRTAMANDQFGSRPSLPSHASTAQRRAATGAYPMLPRRLRPVATAVYPTNSGPPAFHGSALDGTDFRDAYTSPALTAAGQQPYDGNDSAGTLTIATIQLAGWNSSDLTTYAAGAGLAFDASTDLTQVPVDQGSVPPASSQDTGDVEVDLDQESILSTDPHAHQRPYFAPNTDAGYADAFSQVLDDVLQTANSYHGGDPAIAALSVSWGSCEAQTRVNAITDTLEPIMQSLLAAGVTIFASSGDNGIYDCRLGRTGVAYPASSPEVVGVGGTTLNSVGLAAAPNDGTNWHETAWSCTGQLTCQSDGGSGGGASSVFTAPSYQTAAVTRAPFAGSKHRLVPDISADSNPDTGFQIYTTDPTNTKRHGNRFVVGGTSLSAPVSAALFCNALAAHQMTRGVGNIHPALYDAYAAGAGAFRDITSGSNGERGGAPGDPAESAMKGYDTVTGLGAALWPAVVDEFLAVGTDVAPTLTTNIALAHPDRKKRSRMVTARWSAARSPGGSEVSNVAVSVVRAGRTTPTYQTSHATANGTHSFLGVPGATYVLTAHATDQGGVVSATHTASVAVPIDDKHFRTHGRWHRRIHANAVGGSIDVTRGLHAYAQVTATGHTYHLAVRTGPSRGKLAVYLGSRRITTVNLHHASARPKVIRIYGSAGAATIARTFTFRAAGRPRGHSVDVDALYAHS